MSKIEKKIFEKVKQVIDQLAENLTKKEKLNPQPIPVKSKNW